MQEIHRYRVCPLIRLIPSVGSFFSLSVAADMLYPGFPAAPLAPWCFPERPRGRAFLGCDSGSSGTADTSWRGSLGLVGICSAWTRLSWGACTRTDPLDRGCFHNRPPAFLLAHFQCRRHRHSFSLGLCGEFLTPVLGQPCVL